MGLLVRIAPCVRWELPPAQIPLPLWQRLWVRVSTNVVFQLLLYLFDSILSAWRGGAAPARFAVLTAPRSGSTLLVSLLNTHPEVRCAGEVLNARFEHYGNVEHSSPWRQRLHLRACTSRAWPLAPWRCQAVGAKYFVEHVQAFYAARDGVRAGYDRGEIGKIKRYHLQ